MQLNESAIKDQIKNQAFAPLYFIYGEEAYLKRYYVDKLAARAVDPAFES